MAKGFTPLIGLAVVMALALAAVFGSLSLANPALASFGQAADAELSDTEFSPQADVNLKAIPNEGATTLEWRSPNVAAITWTYRYREDEEGQAFSAPTDISGCTQNSDCTTTVSNLANGVTYKVQVLGTTGSGAETTRVAQSAIVSVTPNNAPAQGPDTTVAPARDDNQEPIGAALRVTWAAVTTDAPDKWQYRTLVDNDGTSGFQAATDLQSDWTEMQGVGGSDSGYTIAVKHSLPTQVTMRGVNEYRTGNVIGAVSNTPGNGTSIPAMPTGLEPTAGDESVTLEWTDPKDQGITIWQYRHKSGDEDYPDAWTAVVDSADDADADATSVTVPDLTNGTEYTFQVRAGAGTLTGTGDAQQPASAGITSAEVVETPIKPTPATKISPQPADPARFAAGTSTSIDLEDYFSDGEGVLGEIVDYHITIAGTAINVVGLATTGVTDVTDLTIRGTRAGFPSLRVVARDGLTAEDDPYVEILFEVFDPAAEPTNSPARAVGIISNQSMTVGDPDTVLDVSRSFSSGEGNGAITGYSATAAPEGVVTAAADNNGRLVLSAVAAGTATVTVEAMDGNDADDPMQTFTVTVAEQVNTAAQSSGFIMDQSLTAGGSKTLAVMSYFTDGEGNGAISDYTFMSSDTEKVTVNASSTVGRLDITAVAAGSATVTVTAVDGNDADDPTQTFTVTVAAAAVIPAPNAPTGLSHMDNTAHDAGKNDGSVTVSWADPMDNRITGWQYSYMMDDAGADVWINIYSGMARSVTISNLMVEPATEYTVKVRALVGTVEGAIGEVKFTPKTAAPPPIPDKPFEPGITASSLNPGKNARYEVQFHTAQAYTPGIDHIVIQLTDEKFAVPASISTSTVTIETGDYIVSPADIVVDDQEISLVLGDMDGDTDGVQKIEAMENVRVVFRTSAGISNPVEGGEYKDMTVAGLALNPLTIKRTISLSEEDGGRGTAVTVTGKGFKNGTSVTFVRMESDGVEPADFAAGTGLCVGLAASGVATCDFTVTSPLFEHGNNYINGIDGRSNRGTESKAFELKPSIAVSPTEGSPGESLLVQLHDFAAGDTVTAVKIARRTLCVPNAGGSVVLMADCGKDHAPWAPNGMSFRLVIPNDAPLGVQDLQIVTTTGDDNTTIVISGPLVTSTPTTVLANQRISLVGNGFTNGSTIKEITFGGKAIDARRIAGNQPVNVDGGGNWNASINLPLNTSTVSPGVHTVKVTDDQGRVGTVEVTVPERMVTINPPSGRVGTIAVVSGENFPSKNDEGNSFNVQVVYGSGSTGSTTVSTVPDASGRFEVQMRIPTTASIPSTNDVSISFGTDADGGPFQMNVSHDVPEGIITLSQTSGGPGTTITINGEGFRSYVPVKSVMIGSIDITPSPIPSTDVNGMLSFDVLIPGLDLGIQTVEVKVGATTASVGFTVVESGIAAGDITPVADATEGLGDNLVSVWNFNNDTKVWSFYTPELAEGNTLTHMITGESYLIRVKADQEVILNRDTRNLTCVGDNCWNQVVW